MTIDRDSVRIWRFAVLGGVLAAGALALALLGPLRLGAPPLRRSLLSWAAALPPVAALIFAGAVVSRPGFRSGLRAAFSGGGLRFAVLTTLISGGGIAVWAALIVRLRLGTAGIFADRVLLTRLEPAALAVWALSAVLYPFLADSAAARAGRTKARIFIALLGMMSLVALTVWRTGLGLTKENAFWGEPTVPLLEWHLLVVWALLLAALRLAVWGGLRAPFAARYSAWLIPVAIYLTAALVWLSIPNQHGFFSPPGREPNFETYPFSDGAFYGHYARALMNGMGFKGADIPPRPLYILILALCHLPFGVRYESVIVCQTLILALLPVVIYQVGAALHSRGAGAAAAALCILRETHGIFAATYAHNVSITKYFFADLPAALAAAFFFWALIQYAAAARSDSPRARFFALLSGGALGILTLIRTQSLILLLVALPTAIFANRNAALKRRAAAAGWLVLGLALCVSPWLIRSRVITGSFVFDHPRTQTGELAASYNIGGFDLSREDGMSDGAYQEKLSAAIRRNIAGYPEEIASFVIAHFFNALIASVRLFPVRTALSRYDELGGGTAFWEMGLASETPAVVSIGMVAGCLLAAYGIAAAVRKRGRRGCLPAIGLIVFHFSTALGRYSAGRYLIPMDWAMLLYFGTALAELRDDLTRAAGWRPGRRRVDVFPPCSLRSFGSRGVFALAAALALLGAALPLAGRLFPATLVPAGRAEVAAKLGLSETDAAAYDYLRSAIAIYPRYYEPGSGEPESAKVGYDAAPEGRLMFLTLSPGGFGTMRLRTDAAPAFFPDNATVWIAGKTDGAVTDVSLVLVEAGDKSALIQSGPWRKE